MDLVFINLSGQATPFCDYIAPLVERWSVFTGVDGLSALRPAATDGRMRLEFNCNWKLAVENYCESYHLPWVDPGLNSYSRIEDHYNIVARNRGAGQGTELFEFTERAGLILPRFPLWPAAQLKTAEYIALFPNLLLGLQNDHMFAMVLLPRGATSTQESVQIYYLGDAPDSCEFSHARQIMLAGWREVFREDISVVEGMQRGRASPSFDGGTFSPVLDTATHRFHRWVATRLAAPTSG